MAEELKEALEERMERVKDREEVFKRGIEKGNEADLAQAEGLILMIEEAANAVRLMEGVAKRVVKDTIKEDDPVRVREKLIRNLGILSLHVRRHLLRLEELEIGRQIEAYGTEKVEGY